LWSLTPTASEFNGTRRLINFQNVHQFQVCYNLASSGGPGSLMELDESYDWTTWAPVYGAINISSEGVRCTGWTKYNGQLTNAFVKVTGVSPNSVTAQFWAISLQVQ